ncbi:FRG domain-containing protein [Streptomyces sp. NPDC007907]|uniref:FRG domain-containing protein n=1 Tax=Streptomyces sp. NPDC007907 TaxID=3364789 RepID=UPI0036E2B2BB
MSDVAEFTAHSLEEYQHICESLKNREDGKNVFFRGQVHGYEPQSSEERPPEDDEDRIRRDLLRHMWETTALATLVSSDHGSVSRGAVMGVLQHYGFRSWFIDITDDEMVGLWFARHKYMAFTGCAARPLAEVGGANSEHEHVHIDMSELLMLDMVRHEPVKANHDGLVGPGFVFVFAVDSDSPHLLDLRSDVPTSALRVHRQSGSGLLPENGSYEPFLLARIVVTFPAPAELYSGSTLLSTAELFPGPDEDEFYRLLLRTPRFPDDESMPTTLGQSPDETVPTTTHRRFTDPLGIPLYESAGVVEHIPLLWDRAVKNCTTECLTCIGITEATVDMPFTEPGGARGSRFRPEEILDEKRSESLGEADAGQADVAGADAGGAPTPSEEPPGFGSVPADPADSQGERNLTTPFANWPAESRLFLRTMVMGNLPEFVSSENPFPLLRGFVVQGHAEHIEVWPVSEWPDGSLCSWPALAEPGLRYTWPLEPQALAAKLSDVTGDELDAVRIGMLMGGYFNAIERGEATLFRTGAHQFGFYWVHPDGVTPIGTLWTPTTT